MTLMFNLTNTQIQLALNLAVGLDCGIISAVDVIEIFKTNPSFTQHIIQFWFSHNNLTRRALDKIIVETARQSFESCYNRDAEGYNELEK